MADPTGKLLMGLGSGIVFGFLLQKGWVAKHRVIVGTFLLRDFTAVKIMLTAAAVGSIGVWSLNSMGVGELQPKPLMVGGVIVGGLLFGIGIVVLGYCPGTSVAACGEGRRDAMVGVAGMLAGAGAYVAAYPALKPVLEAGGDLGKLTLPSATSSPAAPWVAGFVALVASGLWLAERYARRRLASAPIRPSERYLDRAS